MIAPPAPAVATPDPQMMANYAMAQQSLSAGLQTPSAPQDSGDAVLASYNESLQKRRPSSGVHQTPFAQNTPMAASVQQAKPQHQQAMQAQRNANIPDGSGQPSAADQMGQSHVANQIPGMTTLINGSQIQHVQQGQSQAQDPGEQWVQSGHVEGQQGLTDAQMGQRRAFNKIFTSMDPKQADTARAIVDAGGNLDHVMKWMDMQAGIQSKQSLADERTAKTNRDDAQANIEYNTYGPGGLKGHEADERNQMSEQRTQGTTDRFAAGRLDRLQKMQQNAMGSAAKQSIQAEIDQQKSEMGQHEVGVAGGGHGGQETDAQINNSAAGQADLRHQMNVAQLPTAPAGGGKLSAADASHAQIFQQFLNAANGDKEKAKQLASERNWSY